MLQFTNSYKHALLISLIIINLPMGLSELRSFLCKNDTNYTEGSNYERNLNIVMYDLFMNSAKTGFHTTSHGNNAEEMVYGLVHCRRDTSPQECSSCSQEANITLQQLCQNNIGGLVWLDLCFLRYENFSFFLDFDAQVLSINLNPQTVNRNLQAAFQSAAIELIDSLISKTSDPANKGFAVGSAPYSSDKKMIFGLVECLSELSMEQCKSCLSVADVRIRPFGLNQGGETLSTSCRIRYERYPFSKLFTRDASVHKKKRSRKVAIVSVFIGGGLLIIGICLVIIRNKMRSLIVERSVPLRQAEGSLFNPELVFSFDTLTEATGKFHEDNKLGEGGFGTVYKGIISDGIEIAVKKLSLRSAQGTREFMNEVNLVSKSQHRNLVQLLGCCVDGPERLLVYEYLPNKSLDTFVFDPEGRKLLDWEKRYNIIIGIARGLLYLHEDSPLRIIHRDVKANNILLDDKLNPKISDFGLARLFPGDETHVHTRVAGTYGYMAPEYAMSGQLSVKADVYGFGVVLLEIVSGRRNTDIGCLPQGTQSLLEWGWILYNGGNLLNMIDPIIVECCQQEEVLRCIHVGLLCVQADVANRPAMSDVVLMLMLSGISVTIPNPTKPAFVSVSYSAALNPRDEVATTTSIPRTEIQLSLSKFC